MTVCACIPIGAGSKVIHFKDPSGVSLYWYIP